MSARRHQNDQSNCIWLIALQAVSISNIAACKQSDNPCRVLALQDLPQLELPRSFCFKASISQLAALLADILPARPPLCMSVEFACKLDLAAARTADLNAVSALSAVPEHVPAAGTAGIICPRSSQ